MLRTPALAALLTPLVATSGAWAKTYPVGPTRAQKSPTTAFMSTLEPGDVVEIDGGAARLAYQQGLDSSWDIQTATATSGRTARE